MRKLKLMLICATVLGILMPLQAQEDSSKSTTTPAKAQPVQSYRLDFSLNELSENKLVNTRHYSMNLTAGNADEIKIGTRVPVASHSLDPNLPTSASYQYLDVGTQIWAQLRAHGDELVLAVRSEVSNLDMAAGSDRTPYLPPVVRQINFSGDTLLAVGKPILIGSMDDPNSKRQFQLEVTVTKLR
jgi:hypothetical protein